MAPSSMILPRGVSIFHRNQHTEQSFKEQRTAISEARLIKVGGESTALQ